MMKYINLLIIAILFFSSCSKETNQSEIDEEIIVNYLEDNKLSATRHESGLYYIIEKTGSGGHPGLTNSVKVKYIGYLTDGSVFDQSTDKTVTFPLNNLISGWRIGIPLMQPGGKAKFIIPSGLGYGSNAKPGIPANSVIIFDLSLVEYY